MCSSSNHDGWNMWGNGMKWTDDFEWRAMIGIVFEFEESLSAYRLQFETLRLLPVLFNFILKWFAFSNIQFNGSTFDNDPQRHSHPAVWRKFAMPSYHHIDISAFHLIHILVPNGNTYSTIHPPKLHDSAFLKLNSLPFLSFWSKSNVPVKSHPLIIKTTDWSAKVLPVWISCWFLHPTEWINRSNCCVFIYQSVSSC